MCAYASTEFFTKCSLHKKPRLALEILKLIKKINNIKFHLRLNYIFLEFFS